MRYWAEGTNLRQTKHALDSYLTIGLELILWKEEGENIKREPQGLRETILQLRNWARKLIFGPTNKRNNE